MNNALSHMSKKQAVKFFDYLIYNRVCSLCFLFVCFVLIWVLIMVIILMSDEWIWENIQQNKLSKVVVNFLQMQIKLWKRFTNEESDHMWNRFHRLRTYFRIFTLHTNKLNEAHMNIKFEAQYICLAYEVNALLIL